MRNDRWREWDETWTGNIVSLAVTVGILWYVATYHRDTVAAFIRWFETNLPV